MNVVLKEEKRKGNYMYRKTLYFITYIITYFHANLKTCTMFSILIIN